jgi:vancomycin resistance protein VanJ
VIEWGLAVVRPEQGLLGVLQVVAPHLALIGLVAAGVAVGSKRDRRAVVAAIALVLVVAVRFGGEWISVPNGSSAAGEPLTVATWNLEAGSRPAAATVSMLQAQAADLVALQELERATADAIEADPVLAARYPYRALHPRDDVLGLGLLSRLPLGEEVFELEPSVQTAVLSIGGRRLLIVDAHPLHGELQTLPGTRLPTGLDVTRRNADLERIRSRMDAAISAGSAAIVLGDLNTASSEPAFDRFIAGLRDVHAEVGEGTGWSWRPSSLEFLGIGLVRIDVIVVSTDLTPRSVGEICPAAGDHCLVRAAIGVG